MLPRYKRLARTTLKELKDLPHVGVYVIAYMGKVLYVGKASESVDGRLNNHLYKRDTDDIGGWMFKVQDDWHNVRLDVLEPPDEVDQRKWLMEVEGALVREFEPLFNTCLQA